MTFNLANPGPPCPRCGYELERDEVDVGPCSVPAGPWGCRRCGYVEPRDAIAAINEAAMMGGTWPPEWLGW
jgi:transposase